MSESEKRIPETGTPHPLVESAWLEEHLDDSDLRVVDATVQVKLWPFPHVKSGRRGFKRVRIPGAKNVAVYDGGRLSKERE
ncbi:hypothetical protein [Marinobacter zhejiangensis]|uniref:Uncharacterized protein n=1 Tax=Marinobacter zhejiangensis TaxID=488535 RepID=A0A1I4M7F9_9GAMM|nr:hypothetical protein [Marinobacter zhejiangensis]SFL98917.1 hypothetical protein SAMN04487963_0884 [Marinobacter zhejiangensis]